MFEEDDCCQECKKSTLTAAQKGELIRLLENEEQISTEWARILFPPEKREYELVYHGKEREEDVIADTLAVPLQPMKSFGSNGTAPADDWQNMLIFGDNLQTLKSLLEAKRTGKLCSADGTPGVKLIYIDPPFATKQDFNGSLDQKAYQDKIEGARFIEFLRKRLILLRELLSWDGTLFLHLDIKKCHYIKVVLDEVFGEHLFQNEIIWKCSSAHSDNTAIAAIHQNIFFYSRSPRYCYNQQFQPYDEQYLASHYRKPEPPSPGYPNGRRFEDSDLTAYGLKGGGYEYTWPEKKGLKKLWRCPIETMRELEKQGRIYYTRNGLARYKRYLDDMDGMPLQDVWTDINPVNSNAVERIDYPTQKPEALLNRIIRSCSNEGDLVLDAFAGSGTTCAVAEKTNRRWIGIDCGKLSIYTIQKRMLNLRAEIGNNGAKVAVKPFTLYNAGLYDFSKLKELPWDSWRFFALQLFQCRDEPHKIGGVKLDGFFKGASVLVFNHMKEKGVRIDEETIYSLHEALGTKVGNKLFIIAPALTFDFQQDYLDVDGVRYYALRIPYSIIHELHQREFTALRQPSDETAVNDTVEAVGFDFIRTPELKFETGYRKRKGKDSDLAILRITTFKSEALIREPIRKGNFETLSMVMLDNDFDAAAQLFEADQIFYAHKLEEASWELRIPMETLGKSSMAVFIDIYGNEAKVVLEKEAFKKREMKGEVDLTDEPRDSENASTSALLVPNKSPRRDSKSNRTPKKVGAIKQVKATAPAAKSVAKAKASGKAKPETKAQAATKRNAKTNAKQAKPATKPPVAKAKSKLASKTLKQTVKKAAAKAKPESKSKATALKKTKKK